MLIKLIIDPTLRAGEHHQLKSNVAVWICQEGLPMQHHQNAAALSNALGFPKGGTVNVAQYTFVTGTNAQLDTRKTPKELQVQPGQQLVLCFHDAGADDAAPSANSPPLNASVVSPRSYAGSSPPSSPRGNDRVRLPSMAPTGNDEDGNETDGDGEVEEEVYHAKERGWMPFVVRSRQGRPVVTYVDPFQPLNEADRAPPTQELCEQCAQCVAGADPLKVVVDRHYRPTLSSQEVVEGWVEKLGGGTFSRWQKRYITITEKSMDWFVNKPEPGEKKKITGHRLFVRDGDVLLSNISDQPDHPKCKEEGFFAFSVRFKDGVQGDKDMYFRVESAKERSIYVNFLRLCDSRARSRSTNRNPVFWKRWVDAFLCNASDLGALQSSTLDACAKFESEIATLETKLTGIRAARPAAEQQLTARAVEVQDLLKAMAEREQRIAQANHTIASAEAHVKNEEELLRAKEQELGDEIKKFRMLEQHTAEQKQALQRRKCELQESIASLRSRHDDVFARWRKIEERPASPNLTASALLVPKASAPAGGTPTRFSSPAGRIAGYLTGAPVTPERQRSPNRPGSTLLSVTPLAGRSISPTKVNGVVSGGLVERYSFSPAPRPSGFSASQMSRSPSPSRVDLRAAVAAARAAFSSNSSGRKPIERSMQP